MPSIKSRKIWLWEVSHLHSVEAWTAHKIIQLNVYLHVKKNIGKIIRVCTFIVSQISLWIPFLEFIPSEWLFQDQTATSQGQWDPVSLSVCMHSRIWNETGCICICQNYFVCARSWFSRIFHDLSLSFRISRTGFYKIRNPWLSRISMTCTNPELLLLL